MDAEASLPLLIAAVRKGQAAAHKKAAADYEQKLSEWQAEAQKAKDEGKEAPKKPQTPVVRASTYPASAGSAIGPP